MLRRPLISLALVVLVSGGDVAHADRGAPRGDRAAPGSRSITRLTRRSLMEVYPGRRAGDLRSLARSRQWRPSPAWLAGPGAKYGTLIAVSDTHPGPGYDPVTGKLNNAEDFKALQESQFRSMLEREWARAEADRKPRTLILNGDTLELMQTSTPPAGLGFSGADRYGPTNTPRNTRTKLRTIFEGHPALFRAYGEHLVRGHRIVLMPGNHDRQLTDPAVRATMRRLMVDGTALHLLGVDDLDVLLRSADAGDRARAARAIARARAIVRDRFEMAPPLFVHGDVLFAHGNQGDPGNSFRTLLGTWYRDPMTTRHQVMEGAWGDHFVKATFNTIEQQIPWGDNDRNRIKVAFQALRRQRGIAKAIAFTVRSLTWVWTRDGRGTAAEEAAIEAAGRADIARMVRETGLTAKLNELRAGQPPLTEADVAAAVQAYHATRARPLLDFFPRDAGGFRRALIALKDARAIARAFGSEAIAANEQAALDVLFERFGIKTYVTGHDHKFRDERYVVGRDGGARVGRLVDTATWTDGVAAIGGAEQMRGVAIVEFDERGSKTSLYNYDPAMGFVYADTGEAIDEGLANMRDSTTRR